MARRFPGRLSPLAVPGAAAVFAGAGFRSPGLGGNGALSACARVEAGLGLCDALEGEVVAGSEMVWCGVCVVRCPRLMSGVVEVARWRRVRRSAGGLRSAVPGAVLCRDGVVAGVVPRPFWCGCGMAPCVRGGSGTRCFAGVLCSGGVDSEC